MTSSMLPGTRCCADTCDAGLGMAPRLARFTARPYPEDVATSQRVQRILSEIRELTDEEKLELEAELLAEDAAAEQAWGAEADRRAARVLAGEATGLRRDER